MLAMILSLLFSFSVSAYGGEGKNDGKISVFNFHEREYAEITYRSGGKYDQGALRKISNLFRSRDGDEHEIDVRLIELIDTIQDHFGAETIELISGYRSPKYNKLLKLEGRGVASESLHMRAQAADIHIDEIREADIFDYVKGLKIGGVGIYPRYSFVHVDVGPPRHWREALSPARVLVGVDENPNPSWSVITDKDEYACGEIVLITVTNQGYNKQKFINNFWFERFRKGDWAEHDRIKVDGGSKAMGKGEAANYEWVIPANWPAGKYRLVAFANKDFSVPPSQSNEFYVKK